MDMQIPPVIFGVVLLIGLAAATGNREYAELISIRVLITVLVLSFGSIGLGFYVNYDSLKAPESPFNKHVSPLLLGAVTAGALVFSMWRAHGSRYNFLVYIFAAGCAGVISAVIVLVRIQNRTLAEEEKPGESADNETKGENQ